MKMKGQLDVTTPAEYIAAVEDKRRPDVTALDALIRKHAPQLDPVIMSGMLGSGRSTTATRAGARVTPASSGSPTTPHTSRCIASPPTRRATSSSGTSTSSRRAAPGSPACTSGSSRTSTRRHSWRSSRRPRRRVWSSNLLPRTRGRHLPCDDLVCLWALRCTCWSFQVAAGVPRTVFVPRCARW